MSPVIAMMVIPLIFWAVVFLFLLSVDRRVRDLERRLQERTDRTMPAPAVTMAARTAEETAEGTEVKEKVLR